MAKGKKKSVKLKDLRSATAASLKAVLGKKIAGKVPIICGIVMQEEALAQLDRAPEDLAKGIAKEISLASGIKVKPGVQKGPGGILVGFIQPKIVKG
jgi:hypothetical protein